MPVNVNIELTDHCNIRCRMCSQSLRDEAHGAPHRFMDWQTWRASLRGLADFDDDVHLCPHWLGEPTIHPEFDRFVEHAFAMNASNRLFAEFKLHTNGVVLSEQRARLLVRLAHSPLCRPDTFRSVHFSLDALSEDTYRLVKGADRGAQVNRNIERFLAVRAEAGATRPFVTLAFVVQPDNAHEAGAFLDHWRAALRRVGSDVETAVDWPSQTADAVYFRPLNCGEQDDADRLHAEVCASLGLVDGLEQRLRASESF